MKLAIDQKMFLFSVPSTAGAVGFLYLSKKAFVTTKDIKGLALAAVGCFLGSLAFSSVLAKYSREVTSGKKKYITQIKEWTPVCLAIGMIAAFHFYLLMLHQRIFESDIKIFQGFKSSIKTAKESLESAQESIFYPAHKAQSFFSYQLNKFLETR